MATSSELPRQIYETTLFDPDGHGDASFLVVPPRSFLDPERLERPVELAAELGAVGFRLLEDPLSIWPAAAVVLSDNPAAVDLLVEKDEADWILALNAVLPSARRGFASYCTTAEVLPVEQSPLEPGSLVGMISRGTATAAGAGVGFLVAGPTLLALVLVPVGMIIFGTAAGVARGLERGLAGGLEHKIKSLLGVPDSDAPGTSGDQPGAS